jgi:hypothetical protein
MQVQGGIRMSWLKMVAEVFFGEDNESRKPKEDKDIEVVVAESEEE